MSTADSLTAALSFGKFGILSMGMDAAGTQANNILARGGSREQALLGGIASGVVEAATEFFSVDKLLQNANSLDAADTFFKALGKQVFTEGTEEMSSEILNILVDAANMGNLSESSQAVKSYMEQGLSYDEARTRVLYDNIARVIESGVAGGISGGISTVITGVGKRIGANAQGEENTQQESKPLTEQAEQKQNQEAQTEKKEATRSAGDGAATDVNPTDHTEEEQQTMREYENAADEELQKTQSAKEASAPAASDRELLSDVSASAAVENSQERKHLREYRETFEKLKKEEQKRDAIAAALETVEPDSAGAASLRTSLRQLEETIARYESRLAKLESSKPLQALLKRLRQKELVAKAAKYDILSTVSTDEKGEKQSAAERIPYIMFSSVDAETSKRLQTEQQELLRAVALLPPKTEMGIICDIHGNQIWSGVGQSGCVSIPDSQVEHIVIHNHPDCRILSMPDIEAFLLRWNMIGMIATGNDGSVYALMKRDDFDGFETFKRLTSITEQLTACVKEGRIEDYVETIRTFLLEVDQYGIEFIERRP